MPGLQRSCLLLAALVALTQHGTAQTVDYKRADQIRVANFLVGGEASATWLKDSVRFWYRSTSKADRGVVYLVDPRAASRVVLFDNFKLAAALSIASDTILNANKLGWFSVSDDAKVVEWYQFRGKKWRCEIATYKCTGTEIPKQEFDLKKELERGPSWATRSKDKKWDFFAYNNNIYYRPAAISDSEAVATNDSIQKVKQDTAKKDSTAKPAGPPPRTDSIALPRGAVQLTTDGEKDFAYGADNSFRPSAVWGQLSPDSGRMVITRFDSRKVRKYPIYSSTSDQPIDHSYTFAAPSDSIVPMLEMNIIDLGARTNVKIQQPRSPSINFSPTPSWGTADQLYVVNSGRGYHRMTILAVDAKTGETKPVMRDSAATWLDFGLVYWGTFFVVGGEDIFWLSERDGFPHIYRYGKDGTLKNQVDAGPFSTQQVLKVDSAAKRLYLLINGLEPSNPYFTQVYSVGFDGSGLTLLTQEPGSHSVSFAPAAPYLIDTYSRPDMPPVTVLRSSESGRVIMELARGDMEYLKSVGWTPPEVVQTKARDGATDIYGLMYKPSNFDPNKKYPIIDLIYPGPFTGSTPGWGFHTTTFGEPRALAELGFIVVQIDHMGTPWRGKSFTDAYVNNMIDNGLPDHVAAIRQLAGRYSWIDLDRVGIFGHSGGGYASTAAMFTYPDFFKVAVSGAGNHHPNTYGYFWAERYLGPYDKAKYDANANYTYAKNLKGHLLLMHGDMDSNVHPSNTLRVVDALIKANKNFDMIIFPDAGHGLPDYSIRKRWDYFVKYLLGLEPPADYEMMKVDYSSLY